MFVPVAPSKLPVEAIGIDPVNSFLGSPVLSKYSYVGVSTDFTLTYRDCLA